MKLAGIKPPIRRAFRERAITLSQEQLDGDASLLDFGLKEYEWFEAETPEDVYNFIDGGLDRIFNWNLDDMVIVKYILKPAISKLIMIDFKLFKSVEVVDE